VNRKGNVSFISKADTVFASIAHALNIIGTAVLAMMMVLTVLDVFMRYAFTRPILGTNEMSEFMMVALSFGMGWCLLKGKTIKMGLVVDRLKPRLQALITGLTYTLGLVVLALITYRTFQESFVMHRLHSFSAVLHIPTYPFFGLLAFSFGILTISAFIVVVKNFARTFRE
jgi:TRAP-type C4-dicarboxylate transport system permease small subunit